jgi:hypothetical protein
MSNKFGNTNDDEDYFNEEIKATQEKETDNSLNRTPKSPLIKKMSDILLSPARFMKKKFRAGGVKGSIFSLVTAILGAGTVSLPFLGASTGIGLSIILIIFGAIISYFCGMLLVSCAEKVGSDKYEDFAQF